MIVVGGFISLCLAGEKAGEHIPLIIGGSQQGYEYNTVGSEYLGHVQSLPPDLYIVGA